MRIAAAVQRLVVKFDPSGQTWKRPNWTNFGFGNGGFKPPVKLDSAIAGEELPIPTLPAGVPATPGKDSPFSGRADFYQLRYGPYLIAMNTTADKTFDVAPPAGHNEALDLISGKTVSFDNAKKLPPLSTMILLVNER